MTGETVGHYRVEEKLGSGGMGVVYRAHDLLLGRDVALKVIRPDVRNPRLEAAFQREARLASSLNHPGIITVYDIVTEGEMAYIVMEFVAGMPLNRLIPARGLPAAKAIGLAIEIGEAVAVAHAAGVIHRDLKPGNILVQDSGGIKVLDFGLAKLLQTGSESATHTMSVLGENKMVGTIAYMAPEQARGEAVDRRADIFSFGVILSQMLTGILPFHAPNPIALLRAMQLDDPAPVRRARPDLPPVLEAITLRALAKEPQDRFSSILEVIELLRSVRDETPAAAAAMAAVPTAPQTAPVFTEGPPSSATQPPTTGSEKTSIAVLPFRSLSSDPEDGYLAAGLASEVIRALTGVPRMRVAPQAASFRLGDEADPQVAAKVLNTRYVVSGTIRRAGERLRVVVELIDAIQEMVLWTQTYDRRTTDIFEVEEEISKSVVSSIGGQMIKAASDQVFRVPTENLDAWGLVRKAYYMWNYEFSPAAVPQAIGMLQRAMELDPEYAAPPAYLGMYLMQMVLHGIAPDPEAASKAAIANAERASALAPSDPEVLESCALVWLQTSHFDRAVQCLKRAVQLAPFDLVAWGYLGLAYGAGGSDAQVPEAHRILTKIIADAPDHPSVPYWLQFLTTAHIRLGRFEEAIVTGRRCIEMQPGYALPHVLLAEAYCRSGNKAEAQRVLDGIPQYNPNFTVAHFEKVVLMIARSQEIVDSLCGCCKSLGRTNS